MSFKGESLEVPEVIEKISIFFQLYGGVGRRQATYQDFYGGFFFEVFPKFEKMVVWVWNF